MAAWTEAYSGTATISTTEYSLPNSSTVLTPITVKGTYQVVIDTSAVVAGDEFEILMKEKAVSGGTQRTFAVAYLLGATGDMWISPAFMLGHGWDFTVRKVTGTDRSLSWSIRAYQ